MQRFQVVRQNTRHLSCTKIIFQFFDTVFTVFTSLVVKMDNLAVTQSFKIGGDRAINILSSGDLFRGLGAVIAV